MYSLNLPVSTLRTKIRQEFERHRYVNQMRTVDVLLFSSHQEFQVRHSHDKRPLQLIPVIMQDDKHALGCASRVLTIDQETLNFWKQTSHVLKYFRAEEDPKAKLPNNFINGFLEVCVPQLGNIEETLILYLRVETKQAPNP
jgi:NADH dehydrogenase (ubiquinone) 1 alpha subcomplex subunit 6